MKKSNLAVIVSIIIVVLAVAVYLFLLPRLKRPSPESENLLNQENTAPAPIIKDTAEEVIGDVSNPYEEIVNQANPFKDEYRNPFE